MLEPKNCPHCGASLTVDAPGGLCLRCLARLGNAKLTTDADGTDSNARDAADGAGRSFGDYELLEEIARGGMGVVYRARQRSLNRIVALKLILSGQFASKQEVLRFRGEAEAAANLRHPNIVAIYETGEHGGQHYFSMDYVAGRNLAELTRQGPLPANDAARYAKTVAEAIHYAHQQGTLHRDLKPSNVLIDDADQPRITDFGLAKRLRGDFGLTLTGQVLGSPSFMPPEQTSARKTHVGPSSDVYGMGAILYHLLTGRPPFQAETIDEVVKQLRECEPVEPRRLNASIPRDLETICLRCLEKDPEKRYATAQELADELGRFQRGEPIVARPVNQLEKAWRWCRRKPAIATLTALLFLSSVGGLFAVLWQLRQTERAHQQALGNLYQALDAVTNYLTLVAEHPQLRRSELLDFRKELLQAAVPFLDNFARQQSADPQLALRRAATYRSLAEVQSTLGEYAEAIANASKGRAIWQALAAAQPAVSAPRRGWAESCALLGKLRRFAGQTLPAEESHREAISVSQQLVTDFPNEPWHRSLLGDKQADLAIFLLATGRLRDGKAVCHQALIELRQSVTAQPALIEPKRALIAAIVRGEGHFAWYETATADRTNALAEALRLGSELAQTAAQLPDDRFQLAHVRTFLGEAQGQLGATSEAERSLNEALLQWEALRSEAPFETKYALGLAGALERLGTTFASVARWAEAEEAFKRSVNILKPPSGTELVHGDAPDQLARTYAGLARTEAEQGRIEQACQLMKQAQEQQESLLKRTFAPARYLAPLARILGQLGELLMSNGQLPEARRSLERAELHYRTLAANAPGEPYWSQQLGEVGGQLERLQKQARSGASPK